MARLTTIVNTALRRTVGVEMRRVKLERMNNDPYPDFDEAERELVSFVQPYTMTRPERIVTLRTAVKYICAAGIQGDVVECGVYKGGSSMVAARTLRECGDASRTLWMYDTYEGMSQPTEVDNSVFGQSAIAGLAERDDWCLCTLDEVKQNMAKTEYPENRIRYVKGKVEDTIPAEAPDKIALLRLDTDWYESTRHELIHLWPRLSPGGVLVIDDYGHWEGCRKAVDEYFADKPILLVRTDYTGRMAVKRA